MRPPHDVAHPVHDLIRTRWSPRAFAPDRPVEPEKLRALLEAARWAPSSFNGQPWNFIVANRAEDSADYERMLKCLVEFNQNWAKSAPVLMIAVATKAFAHNGKPNAHALYDTGAAVALLALQAVDLGLAVHQMAGFSADQVRQAYNVPETVEPVTAIAVGYLGDVKTLSEDLRKKELAPGQRKPISEFAFSGEWGRKAAWVEG